jgi:hypothetical protein
MTTITQKNADKKMKELMLYIAQKTEGDPSFGAIKLNKTLAFSDFLAYLNLGKPITAQVYWKLEMGPAPRRLLPLRTQLTARGDAVLRKGNCITQISDKLVALREPDLSFFTSEQIAIVDVIIEEMQKMNSGEVSELSHRFIPCWSMAKIKEEIPYYVVLATGRGELTDKERDYGLSLARKLGLDSGHKTKECSIES